ncbi:2-phospho-L-lactate transferase CofD family protein, partial [Desulfosarcina sp.]|uniref:gluconeogenesis factor YvcK family protein n=1 Tax=Desulfosarcina sp. TaxID=2027861 RepID=UPI003566BD41
RWRWRQGRALGIFEKRHDVVQVMGREQPLTRTDASFGRVDRGYQQPALAGEDDGLAAIEHATPRGHQRETIRDVYLVPHHSDAITVYPPVLEAIADADIIILGPGDLFTSIIPNLIVPGLREQLSAVSAPIYHVVNIMTKFGETNHFQASDFISTLEGFTGRKLSGAMVNTRRPDDRLLSLYRQQKAEFVNVGYLDEGCQLFLEDLLETSGDVIRHDPEKLAGLIERIIAGGPFAT